MSVLREALVILCGALLYFFVRGLMETQAAVAVANAERLIALEQQLGLFHEPWLQSLVTDSRTMMTWWNRVYIFGHWPVIVLTLVWLVWKHPGQVALYRSALLISGAIGLVFFVLLPVAPPRFIVDQGFVDTVTQHSEAYRVLQPPSFTNQYAAMPSLHVGWNLLMGIAIVRSASNPSWKAFGALMPLVMWLSTMMTANHYLLDGVVGAGVALIGLVLAHQLRYRHGRIRGQVPSAQGLLRDRMSEHGIEGPAEPPQIAHQGQQRQSHLGRIEELDPDEHGVAHTGSTGEDVAQER